MKPAFSKPDLREYRIIHRHDGRMWEAQAWDREGLEWYVIFFDESRVKTEKFLAGYLSVDLEYLQCKLSA